MNDYHPKQYWEARLSSSFDLRGVGHIGFSERYNQWLYRRKHDCLQQCVAGIDLRGKHVLDVGCGTGFFVRWFLQSGAKVTGLDITEVSVRELSARFPCDFHVGDIAAQSLPVAGRFDIVNVWDVLYHIVDDRRHAAALGNIAKVTAPGGQLLFTDWLGLGEDGTAAHHVKPRCLETYQALLRDLGFTLRAVHPLYRLLNRRLLGLAGGHLAPALYVLDGLQRRPSRTGLSAAVWTRTA